MSWGPGTDGEISKLFVLLYPRSGVSCNRFGHLGWNQFFNLLKYSLLELQSDRRRLLFKFHTLQCSLKVQGVFLAFTNQQDHIPFPFCLVSKILKCACSSANTGPCSLVSGVCTILLLFLNCYSPQKSHQRPSKAQTPIMGHLWHLAPPT